MRARDVMEIEGRCSSRVAPKRPIVIVRGQGAVVWDIDGREYIDCIGGHGVCNVGHCHPRVVDAIRRQAGRLIACPNSMYNDVRAKLLERLIEVTPRGLTKAFLANSGAESVECALKLARRYTGKTEVIAMRRGFHGRTMGSLSATWRPEYRRPFEPLVPGFKHVPFGDADAVRKAVTDDTAAVIVEPVQGEGGVHVSPDGYLQQLREVCDDRGLLLVFDEVQTGFGRTGKMLALEHWGVLPDVICLAKAIAGGVPMGATVAKGEVMDALRPKEHGSTLGGNPLACAAAMAAIDVVVE
ncbi:TPA: aminotransferase class III-fold pyridoxal phosphate-dependent enzyme, partial [Candidatus Bathyarchaeota archaeon]|nr:aminotransferase class III-fold pyridoxal phosphate-dependent enzyme [Candidatus Bathyarchaeota archaeon]